MRIVSLCPSISETLIDLGLAESLVGITRFCIHPAQVVAHIQKVGGTKTPDLDAIAALAPDLIFMNEEENRREDFLALSARFRCESSLPKTVADVPAQLRRFGALTGTEAKAEVRALEIEAAIAALAKEPPAHFRYAYLIWREPMMTVNGDTYVSDLLARAGGENLFGAHTDRYPTITSEQLQTAGPALLLLPDEPFPFSEKHVPELGALLPATRIQLVSGDDCSWHGVRSLRGLALARTLRTSPV